MSMKNRIVTPDMVISFGLVVALIAGMWTIGATPELMTAIAGALSGYLGKTIIDGADRSHSVTEAAIKEAVAQALKERGIGGTVADTITQQAVNALTGKKGERP